MWITWIIRIIVSAIWTTTMVVAVSYENITEAQYLSFPKLFYLDDYQHCLLEKDGVYCLGTFDVIRAPDTIYQDLKQYSEDDMNFNRLRLHRGYCLRSRCATLNGTPTERFQRCVERWGERRNLTLQLRTLDYCHKQQDTQSKRDDNQLDLILIVLGVVLLANVLGTLYDVGGGKKETLLSWSAISNFFSLFSFDVDDDSSVVPPGAKVLVAWLVVFNHVGSIHTTLYLHNPKTIEQFFHNFQLMFFRNVGIQIAIMMLSFMFAEHLLKEKEPSLRILLKLLLRKIIRIIPLHMLSLIYITQLWAGSRDARGLHWHLVEKKAQNCIDYFWYTAFFAGNLVDGSCLEHTLYISLVIQLCILSCIVLVPVMMVRASRPLIALTLPGALLVGSCVITAGVAASNNWIPMMMITGPENLRDSFANEPTFHEWYSKPWGFITTCLGGLFLALLLRDIKENRIKISQYRWLTSTIAASVTCLLVALWAHDDGDEGSSADGGARATQLALEGLTVTALIATFVIIFGIPGFLTWYIWRPMSRMSVPLATLYDVIAFTIAASRPVLHHVSVTSWIVDLIGTICYTYLVGIPAAVLIYLPVKRTTILLLRTS